MSWVVSLGAGREQVPLIRAIMSEGYDCMAYDKDEDAPGKQVATNFSVISSRDIPGILWSCSGSKISGVVSAASEVAYEMAVIAHRLETPGIPVSAGYLLRDKRLYKEVLAAAYLPHTEAHLVYEGGAHALFDKLGYDVVVKPGRGSGSRGVSFVRSPMALVPAYRDAAEQHFDVLMERREYGQEVSMETFVWDRMAMPVAFVDRLYDRSKERPVELGGSYPSRYADDEQRATRLMKQAANALGIMRGTVKSDLIRTKRGWKIIEMTARLSGGPLHEIVRRATGVEYFRQAVRVACGIEPDWDALTPKKKEQVAMWMDGRDMTWKEAEELGYAQES